MNLTNWNDVKQGLLRNMIFVVRNKGYKDELDFDVGNINNKIVVVKLE